jgi:RHS repeat-associated protein
VLAAVAGGLTITMTALTVDAQAAPVVAAKKNASAPAVARDTFVTTRPVPVKPRPADPVQAVLKSQQVHAAWPAAGRAEVTVRAAGAAVPAKSTVPVALSQVSPAAVSPSASRAALGAATTSANASVEVLDREQARRAGINGVLLRVTPPAGSAGGDVRLDLDYTAFADAYGADWATRLRPFSLPACALTTPALPRCQQLTPLTSAVNRVGQHTLSGVVRLPAGARTATTTVSGAVAAPTAGVTRSVLVAAEASATGGAGDYTATPLSPSASWTAGTSNGSFTWNYPLRVPPSVNGPSPQLAVGYDSGSVDGRTSSTNNQPSWLGEGFSLDSGYVERHYVPCAEDMKDGNNTTKTGDLCWRSDNASMVFAGHSGELVKDSGDTWRLKNDDGSKIEHLTGGTNADNDKEYWRLTTLDGTQYYFGLGKRYAKDTADTKSTSTVPVAGNQSGEPCYTKGDFAKSFCTQAWRWNLDYVVDLHGNTLSYFYDKDTNRYRRNASAKSIEYDRNTTLTSIEYGERKGSEGTTSAPARVQFTTSERCTVTSSFDCSASKRTSANASHWPDTPVEQICTSTSECTLTQTSPTFFTTRRLTGVTTQVYNGKSYDDVDAWTFTQSFPSPGDGTSAGLWLESLSHVGKVGKATDPLKVSFNGTQLRNRVEDLDGAASLIKYRVNAIDSETGGRISVTYADADCTKSSLPSPSSNTRRCFPGFWNPPGATDPELTWFHKYPATKVVESDLVGGSPDMVTSYEYVGGGAWHHDDNELTRPKYRTWSEWRGFQTVKIRVGEDATTKSLRQVTYLRGMDGDYLSSSSTRSVSVKDSQGGSVVDADRASGFLLEDVTYDGEKGLSLTDTINRPWISAATAGSGDKAATLMGTASTVKRTRVTKGTSSASDDTWREVKTSTTFDADTGLPTQVDDAGDTSTSDDDVCTRTTYVKNASIHLLQMVSRQEKVSAGCSAKTTRPDDVLADARTYYDDATSLTKAPTKGLVTKTERLTGWKDGAGVYTTASRAAYDVHGRVTEYYDALDHKTTTAYTPATGGPVTATKVTNPAGQANTTTLDPSWGLPLSEVDANGMRTDMFYDGLGRLIRVWLPGQSKADSDAATLKFAYLLRTNGLAVVTTSELNPTGKYTDSYSLFDGLLRPRQTQAPASGDDGGRLVTETRYDSRGLAIDQRGPYTATGDPGTSLVEAPKVVPVQTETTFDGAGRPTNSLFRVAGTEKWSTTTSYEGDRVTTTPPAGGIATTVISDALGRMVERRQFKGSSPTGDYVRTTYAYRANSSDLTSVTGPPSSAAKNGSTWTYGYDIAGRQNSVVDPVKGTATTTFDAANQVTSTADSRGKRLFYEYDALGRRTKERTGSATGTVLAEWAYDTVKDGKGRPASATRYVDGKAYVTKVTGYDGLYRPIGGSVTIPDSEGQLAGTYATSMTYARDGNLASMSLPAAGDLAAEKVEYAYNALGEPTSLSSATGGAYVSGAIRTAYGELARLSLTRTDAVGWQSFSYEDGTRRLSTMKVQRSGQTTTDADLAYSYDAAGNVTQIADRPTRSGAVADVQCYAYDGLRRMTDVWTPSGTCADTKSTASLGGAAPYWQSFTYDDAGNRLSEVQHASTGDVTRTYSYGKSSGGQADTLTGVTQSGPGGTRADAFTYDASGNQLTRSIGGTDQTLSWDDEGRLGSVKQGTSTTSYVYDANGTRLLRREPTGTTLYLPGGQELLLPSGSSSVKGTRYYTFDGETVAVRTKDGVTFLFGDHHGTGQWAVKEGTLALSQRRFTAFGAERGTPIGTWVGQKGFVGGTVDSSTGLTQLGERAYDSAVGRFISVDPVFDDSDPQSWNGYGYGNSAPATFSDPTGREIGEVPGQQCTVVACGPTTTSTTTTTTTTSSSGTNDPVVTQAAARVADAQRRHDAIVQTIKKVATEVIKIAADELGITAGIECLTTGDLGACGETALNVLSSFVGGLAGKLAKKYGFPWEWKAGAELVGRLWNLGHEALDAIGGWFKARHELEAAEEGFEQAVKSTAGSCNSFAPGTLVLLADGSSRPIEKLQLGDKVEATDPETGKTTTEPVVATIVGHGLKQLVTVTVAVPDESAGKGATRSESIVATENHPFWSASRQAWVLAGDLSQGDQLLGPSGAVVEVTALMHWTTLAKVHNLTIAHIHTYYVLAGASPVLVHNCDFAPGVADQKYDKHVLGIDDAGKPTRTADMPEYDRDGGFEDYVSDAQKLMCSDTCPAGARQVVRSSDNAIIRLDSKGRIGIRVGDTITTFFRPDNPLGFLAREAAR